MGTCFVFPAGPQPVRIGGFGLTVAALSQTEKHMSALNRSNSRGRSSGAMTGASGSLVPDGDGAEFMPAELRAMLHPNPGQASTANQRRHWPSDPPDASRPAYVQQMEAERNAQSQRDHGHDAPRGALADEPAHQFEQAQRQGSPASHSGVHSLGGDTLARPQDDRF